jgi:hypothetical protein
MAYDAETAERVREFLARRADVVEKPIVGGGVGFMVGGHLCVAVGKRGLTVRIGAGAKRRALDEPHVVPHVVGKRETKAFVVVEAGGIADDAALAMWVERGLRFVAAL